MKLNRQIALLIILNVAITCELPGQLPGPDHVQQTTPDERRTQTDRMVLANDVSTSNRKTFLPIVFGADTKFASAASKVVGNYAPGSIERKPSAIAKAANAFIGTLDDKQREKLLHKLDSPERVKWTNLPVRPNAGGIRLGELNDEQVQAALSLLAHTLSDQGYEKMRLIMLADDQLLRNGRARPGFGAENFAFVIFGTPSETELWSLQFDGHHVGVNIAFTGDELTIAPSFIGTQPVNYELGGRKVAPMDAEVEQAFKLVNLLSEEQFKEALLGNRRGQIRTGPGKDDFEMKPEGIACSKLDESQLSVVKELVNAWVGNMPKRQAEKRMDEIAQEIKDGKMYFSWNGPRAEGSDVSYTIQSDSVLIEFAYQNLGGNPLQHLHTQFRNPKNDYGKSFGK